MTERTLSCKTCDHSRWVTPAVNCAKCKRFEKWVPFTIVKSAPKPIKIRKEG